MSRDDRDELAVVRVEDEPYHVTTREIDVRPRRRWKELTIFAALAGLIAAVGFLSDGGERPEDAASTTTTERRTTTTARRTTSSTAARSTTTTSWPQPIAGEGPLIPGGGTGTLLGLVSSRGEVSIVDADTGAGCATVFRGNTGLSVPIQSPNGRRLVAQSNRSLFVIDAACNVTDLHIAADGRSYPVAVTGSNVWLMYDSPDEPSLREHALATGEATGQRIELPRFADPRVLPAGEKLVIGLHGEMTLVDPASGVRTPLGSGVPIAATADLLAVVACPSLDCRLETVDLDSGERRIINRENWVPWEQGMFSPDGSVLRAALPGTDEPVSTIVEIDTGKTRPLPERVWETSFTADGRWLVGQRDGHVVAVRSDGTGDVVSLELRDVNDFALLY